MVTEVGKECIAALRLWKPDPAWQRSENNQNSREGNSRSKSVLALRDQFVEVLGDVTDAAEQENAIAICYALVRCHWLLLNTQSGYQISEGKINRDIYLQSGLLSSLLGQLEPFLDPADVSQMTRYLTQPVQTIHEQQGQDNEPAGSSFVELPDLSLDLAHLKREVYAAENERAILQAELGFSDADSVVRHVQELQSRLTSLADLQEMLGNLEDTVSLVNL